MDSHSFRHAHVDKDTETHIVDSYKPTMIHSEIPQGHTSTHTEGCKHDTTHIWSQI